MNRLYIHLSFSVLLVVALFYFGQLPALSNDGFTDPTAGKGYFSYTYPLENCDIAGINEGDAYRVPDSDFIYLVQSYRGICRINTQSQEVIKLTPGWASSIFDTVISVDGSEMYIKQSNSFPPENNEYHRIDLNDGSRKGVVEVHYNSSPVGSFLPGTMMIKNFAAQQYQNIDVETGQITQVIDVSDFEYSHALGSRYGEYALIMTSGNLALYSSNGNELVLTTEISLDPNIIALDPYGLPFEVLDITSSYIVVLGLDDITSEYSISWIDVDSGQTVGHFDIPFGWRTIDVEVSENGGQTMLLVEIYDPVQSFKVAVINNEDFADYYSHSVPESETVLNLDGLGFLLNSDYVYKMNPILSEVNLPIVLRDYCAGPFHDDFSDIGVWPHFNTSYASGGYENDSYNVTYTPSSGYGILTVRAPYQANPGVRTQINGRKLSTQAGGWGFYVPLEDSTLFFMYYPDSSNWETFEIIDGRPYIIEGGTLGYTKPLSGYEALHMYTIPNPDNENEINTVTFGVHDLINRSSFAIPPTSSVSFGLAMIATDGTISMQFDDFYSKGEFCNSPPLPE